MKYFCISQIKTTSILAKAPPKTANKNSFSHLIVNHSYETFKQAKNVAKQIGIEEVYYNLLPVQKVERLQEVKEDLQYQVLKLRRCYYEK